ncbi:hypothetical protein U0070_026195 [Myodes glareolus]|uniref:Uncharacterized protein n=1 Tax=Myodes glareolus TaxID=447135 RepID=A0AAW0H8H7_MYOGA
MAFDSIEYVQTFKGLKIKYEEEKERENKVRRNLHDIIFEKLYFKRMKAMEVNVKEEMCPRVNTGDVLPSGGDLLNSYDTFMKIKETCENEVKQSEEKSFQFGCLSHSEASARGMSRPPLYSRKIPLVDYSDDDDDDDYYENDSNVHHDNDEEEEEPPPKRPKLSS